MFGGEVEAYPNSAFGSRASAVIRMCMLEVADVPRRFWATVRPNTNRRNKAKPEREAVLQPLFRLANSQNAARR